MKRTHDTFYAAEARRGTVKDIFRVIADNIEGFAGDRALEIGDIGCATGDLPFYLASRFPACSVTGYEYLDSLLATAREVYPEIAFAQADITRRDSLGDASHDVLTVAGVISIFDDVAPVLDNLLHWVRPGGRVLVMGMFNPHDLDVYVKYKPSADAVADGLESGWNIVSQASVGAMLDGAASPTTAFTPSRSAPIWSRAPTTRCAAGPRWMRPAAATSSTGSTCASPSTCSRSTARHERAASQPLRRRRDEGRDDRAARLSRPASGDIHVRPQGAGLFRPRRAHGHRARRLSGALRGGRARALSRRSQHAVQQGPGHRGRPERLARFAPEARILYMVREPAARIVSQYLFNIRIHGERRPLCEAVRADPRYREIGDYHGQISPYLERFGPDRVRILSAERLGAERQAVMDEVFAWLGLDPVALARELRKNTAADGVRRHRRLTAWALRAELEPLRRLVRRAGAERLARRAWARLNPPAPAPVSPEDVAELRAMLAGETARQQAAARPADGRAGPGLERRRWLRPDASSSMPGCTRPARRRSRRCSAPAAWRASTIPAGRAPTCRTMCCCSSPKGRCWTSSTPRACRTCRAAR